MGVSCLGVGCQLRGSSPDITKTSISVIGRQRDHFHLSELAYENRGEAVDWLGAPRTGNTSHELKLQLVPPIDALEESLTDDLPHSSPVGEGDMLADQKLARLAHVYSLPRTQGISASSTTFRERRRSSQ